MALTAPPVAVTSGDRPSFSSAGGLAKAVTIASIVGLITQSLGTSTRNTGVASLLTLVGSLAIIRVHERSRAGAGLFSLRSRIGPGVLTAFLLAGALGGVLLRQHLMDSQVVDIGEVSDSLHWQLFRCMDEPCKVDALGHVASAKVRRSTLPGGAVGYLDRLRGRLAVLPEGIVHVWRADAIVGQIEAQILPALGTGYVNLFHLAPEERGSGIGDLLHGYVVSLFARLGVPSARLSNAAV